MTLSADPVGAFVVAKLVAQAHTASLVELLCDEFYPHLTTLLGAGSTWLAPGLRAVGWASPPFTPEARAPCTRPFASRAAAGGGDDAATATVEPRHARLFTALVATVGRLGDAAGRKRLVSVRRCGPGRRQRGAQSTDPKMATLRIWHMSGAQELLRVLNCSAPSGRKHFFGCLVTMRARPTAGAAADALPTVTAAAGADGASPLGEAAIAGSLLVQSLWKFETDAIAPLTERYAHVFLHTFL